MSAVSVRSYRGRKLVLPIWFDISNGSWPSRENAAVLRMFCNGSSKRVTSSAQADTVLSLSRTQRHKQRQSEKHRHICLMHQGLICLQVYQFCNPQVRLQLHVVDRARKRGSPGEACADDLAHLELLPSDGRSSEWSYSRHVLLLNF